MHVTYTCIYVSHVMSCRYGLRKPTADDMKLIRAHDEYVDIAAVIVPDKEQVVYSVV
jgi:hypothetical protein